MYLLLTAKDFSEKTWVTKHIPKRKIIISKDTNFESFIEDTLVFQAKNKIKFDGVTTFVEEYTFQASCVAAALKKPFISPSAVINSSFYKYIMRERCKENGIRTPYYSFFKTLNELKKICKNLNFPVVIKPHDGNHSLAVVKINNPQNQQEVTNAFNLAKKEMNHFFSYRFDEDSLFLVEEFIGGSLISVDGVIQNKKPKIVGIAEYLLSPEPLLVPEVNFIPPLNEAILKNKAKIYAEAKKILKALDFDNCGFHCEMKFDRGEAVLIEIGARIAGGPIAKGYLRSYGVDLAKASYQVSLNMPVEFKRTKTNYIMQKAVFINQNSLLKKDMISSKLKKYDYVKDLVKFYQEGDSIFTHGNQAEAVCYYCVEASSKAELKERMNQIAQLELFELEPIAEKKKTIFLKKLKQKKDKLKKTKLGRVLKALSDFGKIPFNYELKANKVKNISWFDFFE